MSRRPLVGQSTDEYIGVKGPIRNRFPRKDSTTVSASKVAGLRSQLRGWRSAIHDDLAILPHVLAWRSESRFRRSTTIAVCVIRLDPVWRCYRERGRVLLTSTAVCITSA